MSLRYCYTAVDVDKMFLTYVLLLCLTVLYSSAVLNKLYEMVRLYNDYKGLI